MPRRKRPYLPGAAFHITARAHCKEHYFDDPAMRDDILDIIARAIVRSDAQLLAFNILTNHYHLIVQQGVAPLAQLVQPINREIALAVHRAQRRKGHVFERRFFAKSCKDADQLREMIIYTHRNAVRAGLCTEPSLWSWCSHDQYATTDIPSRPYPLAVRPPRVLFAQIQGEGEAVQGYLRYLNWRDECDRLPENEPRPLRPRTDFGDTWFSNQFAVDRSALPDPEADLRDVILRRLAHLAPDLTLDDLRVARRTRAFVAIRRTLIASAIEARHQVKNIAKFLGVSDTTVSRVAISVMNRPPVRYDN